MGRSFWLVAFGLASDIVFARTARFAMLDAFVALFSTAGVVSYLLGRRWLSGALWGAAFASKFTALFPFLGFFLYLALRDRGSLAPVAVAAGLAWIAAHAVDIANGLFLLHMQYYWWLVTFHSHKNPFGGWLVLFTGAPWYVYYTKFLYNGTAVVTAVEGPGVYDVLEYEVWISAAPWMGHVAWRALPVEILASARGGGLPPFLAGFSALVTQAGWYYWYFAGVAPFFHLYTRRLYIALQLVFVALLYVGLPPILTWRLGPLPTG